MTESKMPEMVMCPKCKHGIYLHWNYCPNCGTRRPDAKA